MLGGETLGRFYLEEMQRCNKKPACVACLACLPCHFVLRRLCRRTHCIPVWPFHRARLDLAVKRSWVLE